MSEKSHLKNKDPWIDIVKYTKLLQLTEEEAELIEEFFESSRIDGMANTYHFDDKEDIDRISQEMTTAGADATKLIRVFDAIKEQIQKENTGGFDIILNHL